MNLIISLEQRFARTPDGKVWVASTYGEQFWQPYLQVFSHISVLARVQDITAPPPDWLQADGAQVTFLPLPYYVGPIQYLCKRQQVESVLAQAAQQNAAFMMRIPSQIAFSFERYLRRHSVPYALQVVGDPYDVFAPGVVRHPLRPWFRYWFTHQQKRLCKGAAAVAYVTESTLQKRYPSHPNAFTVQVSDVKLLDEALADEPRSYQTVTTLITIGSMDQLYKGIDVLLDALKLCHQQGHALRLVVVGEGKYRPQLKAQAHALGLTSFVRFTGQLSSAEQVRAELDAADLYIMASRTEGLPRALLEAMAQGMACIGTQVGGIPELLAPDALVPANDPTALANKIITFVTSINLMDEMAQKNLLQAQQYHVKLLEKRLSIFLKQVQAQVGT